MCTVSVVPLASGHGGRSAGGRAAGGYRLVCNRDESRRRPEALPPRRLWTGPRRALMPIDPQGGGTWIGVNDMGVTLSLLNGNPRPGSIPPKGRRSRGLIIPRLLEENSARAAIVRSTLMPLGDFAPFRLVIIDRETIAELRWSGRTLHARCADWSGKPAVFSSSGLGDRLVTAPRGALFRRLMAEGGDARRAQDRFHRHAWPARPHLSVVMSRPEARTVSRTAVEVSRGAARMTYEALPPGGAGRYNRPRCRRHRLSVHPRTPPPR